MARILRGEIYWADLDPTKGHEQAGQRPVLVLSQDVFNERSGTVIAMAITSQPQRAGFPLTLELEKVRLPKRSWVKISQIRTLSVDRLGRKLGRVTPEELDRRPSSVGKAIPNCEVFILDDEGREVAPGQSGELVIRGSNVMRGYWNAPKLTNETYKDGIMAGECLLYSGDLFRQDEDGYLYFLGRKDDMIKCRGERVSPKEVENALCEMRGVLEVAVVGVPDEVLGSAVKAFVVPDPGAVITERDVQKFAKENLEPIMVPKYVEFANDLPRTANGKVDKKELKKRIAIS